MTQDFIGFFKEHFNIAIYFITLVIAILNYKKYFDTALKYFPIIIAYTFFNELLGYFIRYSDNFAFFSELNSANDIIYNIYAIVFFGYFFWTYYSLVSTKRDKRIIKIISFIALLSYIIEAFFKNPLTVSLYYAISISSYGLVIAIVIYFKNEIKWHLNKYNLAVWVSMGLLIFYSIFPVIYLSGYLRPILWETYPMRILLRGLIVLMYSCFCAGFIISKRPAFR